MTFNATEAKPPVLYYVERYSYDDKGKWSEVVQTNYGWEDTSLRTVTYTYDEHGFPIKQTSKGFLTKNIPADWEHTYKKIDNNTIEAIIGGNKCIYILSDDGRVIERRWHRGLTEEVYRRQTCRYERVGLMEKITTEDNDKETVYGVKYEAPDEAGNYTKVLGYKEGELIHVTEYVFEYY